MYRDDGETAYSSWPLETTFSHHLAHNIDFHEVWENGRVEKRRQQKLGREGFVWGPTDVSGIDPRTALAVGCQPFLVHSRFTRGVHPLTDNVTEII
jgi:hypothetical protein